MEVGGDFWKEKFEHRNDINKKLFECGQDSQFVMSGRTAIDVAIQDILKNKQVENVYFPSYSCESMMQPFIDRNISIKFYDVYFDETLKYKIDLNCKCDIFFAMNYFGYTCTNMEEYIKHFKKKNTIIIEDSTHSLLSNKPFSDYSDYIVCSLRKWFPINCGGLVSKQNEKFKISFDSFKINELVVDNKSVAMKKKAECIANNNIDEYKDEFLTLFKKSNTEIKNDYIDKLIDDESIKYILNVDLNKVKNQRKKNAKVIYNNLDLNKYKLLINDYDEENDCLLYLPIYMDKEVLQKLKEKIYKEKFYCPSHWPIDTSISTLFENELSIVCDQRYSEEQIKEKMMLLY